MQGKRGYLNHLFGLHSWESNDVLWLSVGTRQSNVFLSLFSHHISLRYFEWHVTSSGEKRPHYFHPPPNQPCLLLAGLWEKWQRKSGFKITFFSIFLWSTHTKAYLTSFLDSASAEYETLYTVSIVTRDAICGFDKVHDRMPAILPTMKQVYEWVNPQVYCTLLIRFKL